MNPASTEAQLPLGLSLDPGCRFDSFFPGPNSLALALVRAMAEAPKAEPQALIWGVGGRGKSHLLQAACAAAGDGDRRAALISGRNPGADPVRRLAGLEQLDLVCLDDADQLCAMPDGEYLLFELINRLRDSSTRLLLSAGRPPADFGLSLADLASRLNWGPVVQLLAMDDTQTAAALRQRAACLGLDMSPEVAAYMLKRLSRDLPSLLHCLSRLDRASLSAQRALTIPFVRQVLGLD